MRQCQPNWWYPAFPASLGQTVGKETWAAARGAQGISWAIWENSLITDLGQCSTKERLNTTLQEEAMLHKSARSPSVGSRAMCESWSSDTSKIFFSLWHLSKRP